MMKKKDSYFLNINWTDLEKNTHRVGFLGLYNNKFYFEIKGRKDIPSAYDHGFGSIPGVQTDKIYVSADEMFNVLKKRLGIREAEKEKINVMKKFLTNKMENETNSIEQFTNKRDRISFGEMNDREIEECKKEIDELEKEDNLER